MSKLTGKTIFLVKVGNTILTKTLNKIEAELEIKDFNFDLPKGIEKAKLYKAIIK